MIKIKTFFPESWSKWVLYTKTSLPVIFSALIFALNSFVDNFMATSISGGNQALSYANTWTTIVTGLVAATTIIGSSLYGQYFGTNDVTKIREVIRGRMTIALFITIIFVIPALISPSSLMKLSSGNDDAIPIKIIESGTHYLRWISISWLLSTWGYTMAMVLRESGYGKATLISSCLTLVLNIILNSIFINFIDKRLELLAFSTIISLALVSVGYFSVFIFLKDKRLILNPLKLFAVPFNVWKQFIQRIPSFLLFTLGSITVSIRYIFWNVGYPTGSIGSNEIYSISAANILGISGMFFSIFWNTFESINANVAIFVGRELGYKNYLEAKKNAKQLQGFHFCISLIMSSLLLIMSFIIVKMDFLTDGYSTALKEELMNNGEMNESEMNEIIAKGKTELLLYIQKTIWPLCWNIPLWVWYITKNRIISSGGMTNVTSSVEAIVGLISISWLSIINFTDIHKNLEFPWAYAIFFLSDVLIKTPTYETLYYKAPWAKNITNETMENAN